MLRELISTVLLIVFLAASLVLGTNVSVSPGNPTGDSTAIVAQQSPDPGLTAMAQAPQQIAQASGRDIAVTDKLRELYGQARQAVSNLKL